MSSEPHDSRASVRDQPEQSGLDPDELRAEQAGDLPERDAMSLIGVGGLEVGLPPAGLLDGILDADPAETTLPVDGLPVEHYPVDRLPIDRLPVDPLPPEDLPVQPLPVEPPVDVLPIDPPGDTLPVEPPVEGDPISVPAPPEASADASVKA
jgi:hypothetical protein